MSFLRRMPTQKKHEPQGKIWIEYQGNPIVGKGGAQILREIEAEQSLSRAAEKLGMSYRYLWSYVQKINAALGEHVVETFKGGRIGGGGAKLTDVGRVLLDEYRRLEGCLSLALSEARQSEVMGLRLSARNQLKGKVVAVEKGVITAKVKVEIMVPAGVTAGVTQEGVGDLDLK